MYDILWSDGTATQEVRPVSDGVVPIGLCVIPTNWLDENEKARFMSLKYMSSQTPKSGGLNNEWLSWGNEYWYLTEKPKYYMSVSLIDEYDVIDEPTEIPTEAPTEEPDTEEQPTSPIPEPIEDILQEYWIPFAAKNESKNLEDSKYVSYNSRTPETSSIKDLRIRENWLYTLNYCKENPDMYAIGDINGKQNTINISIEGNYNDNSYNKDMKPCIAKYAPIGTQAGDWYVPGVGELIHLAFRVKLTDSNCSIDEKLQQINEYYPNDCIKNAPYDRLWSSSINDGVNVFVCSFTNGPSIYEQRRANLCCPVIAFLQR